MDLLLKLTEKEKKKIELLEKKLFLKYKTIKPL